MALCSRWKPHATVATKESGRRIHQIEESQIRNTQQRKSRSLCLDSKTPHTSSFLCRHAWANLEHNTSSRTTFFPLRQAKLSTFCPGLVESILQPPPLSFIRLIESLQERGSLKCICRLVPSIVRGICHVPKYDADERYMLASDTQPRPCFSDRARTAVATLRSGAVGGKDEGCTIFIRFSISREIFPVKFYIAHTHSSVINTTRCTSCHPIWWACILIRVGGENSCYTPHHMSHSRKLYSSA